MNCCVHDEANAAIASYPERRWDGVLIFVQRLLYFMDDLVDCLTNNLWDILDR